MPRPPFAEKGSCRYLVYEAKLPPDAMMCLPCQSHEAIGDRNLRIKVDAGIERKDGVCLRLNRQLTADDGDDGTNRRKRTRSRSAPVAERITLMSSDDEYIDNSRPNDGHKKKKKKRRGRLTMDWEGSENTVDAMIHGKEVKYPAKVQRKLLEAIAGTSAITVNPCGTSKATKSSENSTAAKILNGAARLMAGDKGDADECRDKMVTHGYRKEQSLETTETAAGTRESGEKQSIVDNLASNKETEKKLKVLGCLLRPIRDMEDNKERRPILAAVAVDGGISKTDAENFLGAKISKREWNLARIHSKWPGPYKPVP